MHITTKIVSTNPTHGEMYSLQLYVINFSLVFYIYLLLIKFSHIARQFIEVISSRSKPVLHNFLLPCKIALKIRFN
jgi:hypothetical protein